MTVRADFMKMDETLWTPDEQAYYENVVRPKILASYDRWSDEHAKKWAEQPSNSRTERGT